MYFGHLAAVAGVAAAKTFPSTDKKSNILLSDKKIILKKKQMLLNILQFIKKCCTIFFS
jgi:hypothetical protein